MCVTRYSFLWMAVESLQWFSVSFLKMLTGIWSHWIIHSLRRFTKQTILFFCLHLLQIFWFWDKMWHRNSQRAVIDPALACSLNNFDFKATHDGFMFCLVKSLLWALQHLEAYFCFSFFSFFVFEAKWFISILFVWVICCLSHSQWNNSAWLIRLRRKNTAAVCMSGRITADFKSKLILDDTIILCFFSFMWILPLIPCAVSFKDTTAW